MEKKISTQYLLVRQYFLQTLSGMVIRAANWGQGIRIDPLPLTLGIEPFKLCLGRGVALSPGLSSQPLGITDMLYRRGFIHEPKKGKSFLV